MKRGIVIQITSKELTVLTPDGEFIKINREHKNYNLGEEIPIKNNVADLKPGMNSGWKRKALLSVLAATLMVVASFTPNLISGSKVSAYISMDVHSSIELGITEDLEVIEVKGINQEGKHIVNNLNEWQGQDLEVVIDEVLALNHSAGYIGSNQNILFSTVIVNKDHEELEESLEKKLKDVEDIPRIQDTMKVEMKKATVDDRREASDKGISTGTYLEQTNKKPNTHSSTEKVKKTTSVNSTKKQSSSPGENVSTKQKTIHNQNRPSSDYKKNDEKASKSREKTLVNQQQQKNSKPDTVHINKDKENSRSKIVNKKIPKDPKVQEKNKTVSKTGTDKKKTNNNKNEQSTKSNPQSKEDSGRNVKGKDKNNPGLHKQKNKPPVQQKHKQDLHKQKQKKDQPNKHKQTKKGPEHKNKQDKHNKK